MILLKKKTELSENENRAKKTEGGLETSANNKKEISKTDYKEKDISKGKKNENEKSGKKSKKNLAFKITGLIILIGIFILFFMLSKPAVQEKNDLINNSFKPESYKYNGFLFQKGMYAWYSKIRVGDLVYDVSFVYGPKEVDDIPVLGEVNDLILKAKEIYITTEPDYPSRIGKAQVEISKITSPRTSSFGILNIPTINTVTYIPEEIKGKVGYPEITCKNASANKSVIYLKIGSETKIYNKSYCVVVEGSNDEDVVRAADRLIYNLLGIIK